MLVDLPGGVSGERFEADLEALDGQSDVRLTVVRTDRTATAALLTLTVAASRLVDGDLRAQNTTWTQVVCLPESQSDANPQIPTVI